MIEGKSNDEVARQGGDECYCKATCKAEKKGLKDGTSVLKYIRRW